MPSVRKLLVPIDFSQQSEKALKYASSLARQINGELIVLHVVDDLADGGGFRPFIMPAAVDSPFSGSEPPARPIDVILRERALDLWNFIDRTVRDVGPVKLKKLVRLGSMREEIIAVARQENIDFIVLELRNRFLFPNLANRKLLRMIDNLPFPVLLAPPSSEDTSRSGKSVWAFHLIPSQNPV
jgi:nucleotide-binding universal stress UspA family protein